MNSEIADIKNSYKKKPLVESDTLRRWGSRAVMILLVGSIIYREVLPKVQKFIKWPLIQTHNSL